MKIVVCIKRVAATDSKIQIAGDGKSIDPTGVEFVLNPYDEFAVEEAIKTREAKGEGEVIVVTLGGGDAQKELRTCLAMGADKAFLLDNGGKPHDAYATAAVLAKWVQEQGADLVFCGKQAVDGDDSQFPGRLAQLLGWPCMTEVLELTIEGDQAQAARDIEGGREKLKSSLPCVVSTNKGLNEPRYASLKGIMAAKKKPLETVAVDVVDPATETAELALPPARPEGKVFETVDQLIDALKNDAKVL